MIHFDLLAITNFGVFQNDSQNIIAVPVRRDTTTTQLAVTLALTFLKHLHAGTWPECHPLTAAQVAAAAAKATENATKLLKGYCPDCECDDCPDVFAFFKVKQEKP